MLEVLRIGSRVRLRNLDHDPQPAIVTGLTIRERNKVTYEVAWWTGGTRNTAWVEECELDATEGDRSQIGFKG